MGKACTMPCAGKGEVRIPGVRIRAVFSSSLVSMAVKSSPSIYISLANASSRSLTTGSKFSAFLIPQKVAAYFSIRFLICSLLYFSMLIYLVIGLKWDLNKSHNKSTASLLCVPECHTHIPERVFLWSKCRTH